MKSAVRLNMRRRFCFALVVYNGEYNLKELISINNLSCDNVVMLTENEGLHRGTLDGINASLKNFIESDKSIGVIHNFILSILFCQFDFFQGQFCMTNIKERQAHHSMRNVKQIFLIDIL